MRLKIFFKNFLFAQKYHIELFGIIFAGLKLIL